eukprot:4654210-Pyramimonas_sp.AAC.1
MTEARTPNQTQTPGLAIQGVDDIGGHLVERAKQHPRLGHDALIGQVTVVHRGRVVLCLRDEAAAPRHTKARSGTNYTRGGGIFWDWEPIVRRGGA